MWHLCRVGEAYRPTIFLMYFGVAHRSSIASPAAQAQKQDRLSENGNVQGASPLYLGDGVDLKSLWIVRYGGGFMSPLLQLAVETLHKSPDFDLAKEPRVDEIFRVGAFSPRIGF